jgi:rubrerythrin
MNIAEGLQKGIKAELEGNGFYTMAANSTSDPKGREVFLTLAAEELDHMKFLKGQYESIIKTGRPDPELKLGARMEFSGGFPIFSESIKARLGEAHIEMSALAIGIQLELDAMNFYKSQAKEVADAEMKKFYEMLAEWETGHYHALLSQQELLKEDYWADAGFAPF